MTMTNVGGCQRRITMHVPDTAATDAQSACDVAKGELEKRLTLLHGIANCVVTP